MGDFITKNYIKNPEDVGLSKESLERINIFLKDNISTEQSKVL